jgi:Flp pilus assembly protein TadD
MITTVPEGARILTKDGSTLPISEAIASPVKDDAGTITGAAVVIYPDEREIGSIRPAAASTKSPTSPLSTPVLTPAAAGPGPRRPVTADDWIDRGNSLIFLRRFEDAILAYDQAIALHPTNYQAWYGKGTALSKTGKPNDALAAFDRALTIHPRNHQVLMAKGVLLKKAGQDADADRCFELANLYTP